MTHASVISADGHVSAAESARSFVRLSSLTHAQQSCWRSLSENACEPNAFFDPAFALATLRLRGHSGRRALIAYGSNEMRMAGLLPVDSAWRALGVPAPVLVAPQTYTSLTTPLLAAGDELPAASGLIDAAAEAGARLLVLPKAHLDGRAAEALRVASARKGLRYWVHGAHERAMLTASGDSEARLRDALGGKKLKELRRQRNRLRDVGPLEILYSETPAEIPSALERFLRLEASGWKGRRGTALGQRPDNAAFIQSLANDFAAQGAFTLAELTLSGRPIASGIVMRAADRAFLFKIAYDEAYARHSPGVQLILELTRRFIDDPRVKIVDSVADANHPMIDHVWRERMRVGDIYISTASGDLVAQALVALLNARAFVRSSLKSAYYLCRNFLERKHEPRSSRR